MIVTLTHAFRINNANFTNVQLAREQGKKLPFTIIIIIYIITIIRSVDMHKDRKKVGCSGRQNKRSYASAYH